MLAILMAAAVATPVPTSVSTRAEARIRILTPGTGTKVDWDKMPPKRRGEIVRDEYGQKSIIRVIDFE